MAELASFPYIKIQFTKHGELRDRSDLERARDFVRDNKITDLFVVSHGWNNDNAEAQSLYDRLFTSLRCVIDAGSVDCLSSRTFGVLGIFWPSKRFKQIDMNAGGGGAASVGGGDESDEELKLLLAEFDEALDSTEAAVVIGKLKSLTAKLDNDPAARETFADRIRSLLPRGAATPDDGSDRFFDVSGEKLFSSLEAPIRFRRRGSRSGGAAGEVGAVNVATGGAAGIADCLRGTRAAARRILNYSTYYLMKARAGTVGAIGVREVVSTVKNAAANLKVHLVGHSFGGRVVTAASLALGEESSPPPSTMTLLQAAFSHNGFAEDFAGSRDGHFRAVAKDRMVDGPILITYTQNDQANATAYPIASRIAGQDAAAVGGGPGDKFGAIGANGAQHTPEAVTGMLLEDGAAGYAFEAGKLYNLNADNHIEDHGDVGGREVALAILHAVATT